MLDAPKGLRLHIALFGRRNAGKSSLLNALTGQEVSIVSETPGTTTDPVEKTLEFLPLGPVVFLDTAGLDDEGELGRQRVEKTCNVLPRTDIALVVAADNVWGDCEREIVRRLNEEGIPCVAVLNKADKSAGGADDVEALVRRDCPKSPVVRVSARTGQGIAELKEAIISVRPDESLHESALVADLLPERGIVILVVPIDSGAPKGRLILPQVQTIRDALDGRKICMVVTEEELVPALDCLAARPSLVVCDSQVVHRVARDTPGDIPLTTFSILMARLKGDLPSLAAGAAAIGGLKPGDRVLVMEACSHHPQKDDIGRIKIPRLLERQTGGSLSFDMCAGKAPAECADGYSLVVHCGGCTLTRRQMLARLKSAKKKQVPMTNYGVAISFCQGVLERVLTPFPEALASFRQARG
ncbi:MAG: [FeFe] hydrogenase H-cluster maturation GTPase HydF [Desulfovibrionaceae bacterium]|nr:[FeFe] hydrogenase H-cluster maturation GTPase HydF [Desulfovibrionaceae bacterium]